MAKLDKSVVNYARRWLPDFRWRDDKHIDCSLKSYIDMTNSITDKESYRVTLASLRGELAQGSGSITHGSYSIPAGKDYDPNFDFSFLNRKDLTIVQIDEYIENFKRDIQNFDTDLQMKVQSEIEKAERKKAELEKVPQNKDSSES